ncbi:MAG: ABC transporter permease [Actinobacteria bacterium]|nr:ABC transporter permease [Actinomycetota bacterium]
MTVEARAAGEARTFPPLRGAGVVLRRELRALVGDKQAVYVTVVFGLIFPFLISRDPVHRPGGVIGLILQVSLFPFVGAFQTAIGSFVSERERATIGPLLATPLTNSSIFGGKLLGSYIPGLGTAAVSVIVLLATLSSAGRAVLTEVPGRVIVEAITLSAVTGLVLVLIGTLIGSRAKTMRGAQLFSGVIIAPVFIGMFALGGTIFAHETIGWFVLLGMALLCVPATMAAAHVWRREEILTKI